MSYDINGGYSDLYCYRKRIMIARRERAYLSHVNA